MKKIFRFFIWMVFLCGICFLIFHCEKPLLAIGGRFLNSGFEAEQRGDGGSLEENFETILQSPELPTGCEITALTMVLNHYGFAADKVEMARQYLPTQPYTLFYGEDGRLYGSDLKHYFIGDPEGKGYVCGAEAIVSAADVYLKDAGSSLRAENLSGISPEKMYAFLDENIPVIVWTTIHMERRQPAEGWYTEYGDYVDWSTGDHCGVLIGYTDSQVTLADPISGRVVYDRGQFERAFASRQNKCLILR